ncbi:hypothetical protein [Mycobacterium hubeiense]|nr:hypothetical protein [Mycobacterium sp. QGD 101]
MASTEPRIEQAGDKVSLPTLTAMVVGSMIGSRRGTVFRRTA